MKNLSIKKLIPLIISLILLFLVPPLLQYAAPYGMLSIFIGAILLWLFVDVGYPSLFVLIALSFIPAVGFKSVISASFGNTTIMFLIFSFTMSYALQKHGVLKYIAQKFIYSKIAAKSPIHLLILINLATLLIGSFMAPTITFMLFLPILYEIFNQLNLEKGPYTKLLTSSVAITTSISCGLTPFHTFPLMAIGFYEADTGLKLSFTTYMKYSVPVFLAIFIISIIVYILMSKNKYKFEVNLVNKADFKFTKESILAISVFVLTVIAWLSSGLMTSVKWISSLNTAIPPMIATAILLLFNNITFDEAFSKAVSWKSIFLCATTLALGKFFTDETIGIAPFITTFVSTLFTQDYVVLIVVAMAGLLLTNIMSSIVTVTLIYTLAAPLLMQRPELFVIATVLAGITASMDYATPPAIAHIAISGSSDYNTPMAQFKYGSIATFISAIVVLLFSMIVGG